MKWPCTFGFGASKQYIPGCRHTEAACTSAFTVPAHLPRLDKGTACLDFGVQSRGKCLELLKLAAVVCEDRQFLPSTSGADFVRGHAVLLLREAILLQDSSNSAFFLPFLYCFRF